MRTAIYTYAPAILTIVCAEAVRLSRLDRHTADVVLRAGTHQISLATGVYRLKSHTRVVVTGADVEVVTMRDQDRYPYPPARLLEAFPSITRGELVRFFRRPAPHARGSSPGPFLEDFQDGGEMATHQGGARGKRRLTVTSTPTKPAAVPASDEGQMSFRVTSDPTVQITIYDASRTIRGQAEGSVRLSLPAGLYRVDFERGGLVHKEVVDHERTTELQHPGPPLRSPVPFATAATSHDYYIGPAQKFSVEDTGPSLGDAPYTSRLFVFLRRSERGAGTQCLPSEPITIHDVDGRPLTTISRCNAVVDDDSGYVAFSISVAPATYRVRTARSRRDIAITIPEGRAAHVFVADTGMVRFDELRVSLVPIAARFDPTSSLWGAMESMLVALRSTGRTLPAAARALLPDAVEQDLCFGIVAAHLLWRGDDWATIATVMQRLEKYRELPDVAILDRLRGLDRSAAMPQSPPLVRASLVMAMTRPEIDSRELSADCALAQAARTRLHDSVWCTWSARVWDERWIEPTVERLRARDRRRDATSIARSLALPTQTVEQTLRALDATIPSVNGHPLESAQITVPGYVLDQIVGRGVQSIVFRATRLNDARMVALKLVALSGGADECARVHRDLDRIEPMDHPRILSPVARGSLPGDIGIWLDMELCRGSVLDLLSEAEASLPIQNAERLVCDALAGLAHLHRQGIVHGGIKPENMLVRDDGSIAIADIGVTCRGSAAAFRTTASCPRFAPPELLLEHAQPQASSDVWSIAATLYFLLTLELPRDEYAGQSRLEAARDNPVVSIATRRSDIPPELARCIDCALSREILARPKNAGAFREQLLRAVCLEAIGATGDQRAAGDRKIILFLAANPKDTSRIDLEEECAAIERELQMARHGADFEFRSKWAVSVDEMARHLIDLEPAIVHFTGRGQAPEADTRPAHSHVMSAAFSRDATHVIVRGGHGLAWNALTGEPGERALERRHGIISAAFSPDGTRVVTASEDATARVWVTARISDADLYHAIQLLEPELRVVVELFYLEAMSYREAAAAVNLPVGAIGTRLTRARRRLSELLRRQGDDRRLSDVHVTPPLKHRGPVLSAMFSPDGGRVVTASWDKTARVWDAASGSALSPPLEHHHGVTNAAFSPNGLCVVTASSDKTVRVWDAATGKPISPPLPHRGIVLGAAFNPDGKLIVTESGDQIARVWDT